MSLTPEDVNALTNRFATKSDLDRFATKEDLERFATKEDLAALRAEMATRSEMRMMFEELKSTIGLVFEGLAARLDLLEERTFGTLPNHEERIAALELRVGAIFHRLQRKQ